MTANPLTIKMKILEEFIKFIPNKDVKNVELNDIIAQTTNVTETLELKKLMETKIISDVNNEVVQEAKLLASVTPKQGNLRTNNLAQFTLDVISTYTYDRTFPLHYYIYRKVPYHHQELR